MLWRGRLPFLGVWLLLGWVSLLAQEEDDAFDVEAVLADDALLDELLFGDAELPEAETVPGVGGNETAAATPATPDESPRSPSTASLSSPGEGALTPQTTVADEDAASTGSEAPVEGFPELAEEESSEVSPHGVSLWDWENRLTFGGGYKRNVLFSAFSQEDSPFLLAEWESTLIRAAGPRGWQMFGYWLAENRRYADVDGLDEEWLLLGLAQIEKPLGDWKVGLSGQYLYLQQAFSLEFEEIDLGATEVVLHQFQGAPKLRYALNEKVALSVRVPVAANRFDDDSLDYDQLGVVMELEIKGAREQRVALSYAHERRDYTERTERTRDGDAVVGDFLHWEEHKLDLALDLPLGGRGTPWQSRTRLRYRQVRDGGSGYYDFRMVRASQALRYDKRPWSASVAGSYAHYDYPVQTKADGDPNQRHRSVFSLRSELTHAIADDWTAFGRYAFESYLSNVPEDQYDAHVFTLGLQYSF